jgi:hypothetical protein
MQLILVQATRVIAPVSPYNVSESSIFGSPMFFRKYLLLALLLTVLPPLSTQAEKENSSGPAVKTFAFWYDPWQPDVTLKKLGRAGVLIGVPPRAVAEIHKSGRRALQYLTYYQSQFSTAFLNDRNDLLHVAFQVNGVFEKSAFGGKDNYVLCPNSVELKARALRYLDSTIKQGFDGYFVDNTFLQPAAHQICTANHQHVSANVQGGRAYVDLLTEVREKIKRQSPFAIIVSNPGDPSWASDIASGQPSLWDVSDYVVWESYGYSSYNGQRHDRWKRTLELSFKYSMVPDKARKILALSYPRNIIEARFAFAVARIFGFQWTANLGDRDENTDKEEGHSGAFLNDIPFDTGEPLGRPPDHSTLLLHRRFTNGEIFANAGTVSQPISVPPRFIIYMGASPPQKTTSEQLVLQPMAAAIVLREL